MLRFPFFFRAVIDWDESSFVLMGQALLDGHLPYVELWDNKSPLSFVFYALAIAAFGRDVVGIRVAGALCVALAAFLVQLTGSRLWNHKAGVIAAILSVVGISLLSQATMTELVVLPPLVGALYLLIRDEATVGTWFLVGVLLGAATLVRLNMGFVVIIVGLYSWAASVQSVPMPRAAFVRLNVGFALIAAGLFTLAASALRLPLATATLARFGVGFVLLVAGLFTLGASAVRAPPRQWALHFIAYAAGGTLVAIATWLPYALAGQQKTLWNSAIVAALVYSNGRYSTFESLVRLVQIVLGSPLAFLWIGALGGLAVILRRWERASDAERRGTTLLALFTIGTVAGILKSGGAYGHYLIQVVPFASLLSATLLQQLAGRRFGRPVRWGAVVVAGIVLVVSLAPIVAEYDVILARVVRRENPRYGVAYDIAAYLKRENPSGRPVYAPMDSIVYWLIGGYPPTRMTTHSSTIAAPDLVRAVEGKDASTEGELRKVFRQDPEFVVTPARVGYLSDRAQGVLREILAAQYVLTTRIGDRGIYRRTR